MEVTPSSLSNGLVTADGAKESMTFEKDFTNTNKMTANINAGNIHASPQPAPFELRTSAFISFGLVMLSDAREMPSSNKSPAGAKR